MKNINIAKWIVTITLLLLSFTNFAQKGFLLINGTVQHRDDQEVKLLRYTEGPTETLGSFPVVNGKFRISIPVDEIGPVVLDFKSGQNVLIMEKAQVHIEIAEDGNYSIHGGKYNKKIMAYLVRQDYVNAQKQFYKLTQGGNFAKIKGTEVEWEATQLFLQKQDIRSTHLDSLFNKDNDPVVKAICAIMNELQPDADRTLAVMESLAGKFNSNNKLLNRIRAIYQQQQIALAARQTKDIIGQQFTDFAAQNLTGEIVRMNEIVSKNKYTLLQFWASWCSPCRKEIPELKALIQQYGERGFGLVSFSLDDNAFSWKKASEIEDFSWPNLSDLKAFNSPIIRNYPVQSIPANVVIDQTGKIVAVNIVGHQLRETIGALFLK